jgi:hypothetical protein
MKRARRIAAAVLALVLTAEFTPNAARADTTDLHLRYSFGGQRVLVTPTMTLSGSYLIYVTAHNERWITQRESCSFLATLKGDEHLVPDPYETWGLPIQIRAVPFYKKQYVVTFEPGHYRFRVSPISDCTWRALVVPWDRENANGPLRVTKTRLLDLQGATPDALRYGVKYAIAAYVSGSIKGVTAELHVLQDGTERNTIPLRRAVADDGSTFFGTTIAASEDGPVHLGVITLRFVLTGPGNALLSRDLNVTLAR